MIEDDKAWRQRCQRQVEEAAATASGLAKWMGLDEVVDYLRDPDQVAFYGMMNVLPATPIRWSLEDVEAAVRQLHYGLARWHHRPLEPSLVPIDLITGVLRIDIASALR